MISTEPLLLLFLLGAYTAPETLSAAVDASIPLYCCLAFLVLLTFATSSPAVPIRAPTPISPKPKPIAKDSSSTQQTRHSPSIDLTGTYKLIRNDNYQRFLAIQGVNWALRKAADAATTVHIITHDIANGSIKICVQGLITGEQTYSIYGPAVTTHIREKTFSDTVTYLESGDGVEVVKVNVKDRLKIVIKRRLEGDVMSLEQTCFMEDGTAKSATAVQYLKRVE